MNGVLSQVLRWARRTLKGKEGHIASAENVLS